MTRETVVHRLGPGAGLLDLPTPHPCHEIFQIPIGPDDQTRSAFTECVDSTVSHIQPANGLFNGDKDLLFLLLFMGTKTFSSCCSSAI